MKTKINMKFDIILYINYRKTTKLFFDFLIKEYYEFKRRDYSLNLFFSKVYNLMEVLNKQNNKYDRYFYIKALNRITKDASLFLLKDIKKFFSLDCEIVIKDIVSEFRFDCCQYFYNNSILSGCDKVIVPSNHVCECDRYMKFHHCVRIGFEKNRRHIFLFQKNSTIFYLYF